MPWLIWVLALALVAVGVAGTVLPGLPGPILVFAGVLLAAWSDGFARISVTTVVLLALLTTAAYALDFLAAAAGVRLAGASRRAMIGAALGAAAGIFFGLAGIVIGPFAGAIIGELSLGRDWRGAGRAGVFAGLAVAVGLAAKLAIVLTIVGLAATAFFLF